MKILVASKNPVKVDATKKAFEELFPSVSLVVEGVAVESGVSNQPMSRKEAISGAKNRARNAMEEYDSDFAVGLEGGIYKVDEYYLDVGWVVVLDRNGIEGLASTIQMEVQTKLIEYIKKGHELGEAMDYFFNKTNTKQNLGHFGMLTNGYIFRTESFKVAVMSALVRFRYKELY